jgi:hypothetical protein
MLPGSKLLTAVIEAWRARRQRRRSRPQTRLRRTLKRLEWLVMAVCAGYLVLVLFPYPLFAHRLEYRQFDVCSTEPIPAEIGAVLDRAAERLAASEIEDAGLRHRIFLCNGYRLFALFAPTSRHSFGNAAWFSGHIFVANADIAADQAIRDTPINSRRSLSGTIAHECTHRLIERRVGLLKSLTLPRWKKEGYCEVIAREGSLDPAHGAAMLKRGEHDGSGSFQYFRYRLMVDYLVHQKRLSFDELISGSFDPEEVEAEAIAALP